MTQPARRRPADAFTYRLRFPDAGIYWYHPHVREDIQQELGLYGNMLVRSASGAGYGPANREEVLMLDDLLVDDGGLVPLGREAPTHALMGRFGNTDAGERRAATTACAVKRGEVVRFYLTNAANTRTFNLSFPGARMKLVASDVGQYEREEWVESVVIAPAERYVVDVRFDRPGQRGDGEPGARARPPLRPLLRRDRHARRGGRGARRGSRPTSARLQRRCAGTPARRAELERYPALRRTRAPEKTLVLTLETHGLPAVTRRLMQLDSIYFAPVEWSGDHADDELGLHRAAGALDPARPGHRPGEHGHRLALSPWRAGADPIW